MAAAGRMAELLNHQEDGSKANTERQKRSAVHRRNDLRSVVLWAATVDSRISDDPSNSFRNPEPRLSTYVNPAGFSAAFRPAAAIGKSPPTSHIGHPARRVYLRGKTGYPIRGGRAEAEKAVPLVAIRPRGGRLCVREYAC